MRIAMRYGLSFLVLFVAIVFANMASAATATCDPGSTKSSCIGQPCDKIGNTLLDYGQQNIISCLYTDSKALVWKTMSSGDAAPGTWCGLSDDGQDNTWPCFGPDGTAYDPGKSQCPPSWVGLHFRPKQRDGDYIAQAIYVCVKSPNNIVENYLAAALAKVTPCGSWSIYTDVNGQSLRFSPSIRFPLL